MKVSTKIRICFIVFSCFFLLAGCYQEEQVAKSSTITFEVTSLPVTSALTMTPSKMVVSEPINTPTKLQIKTPTWTPLSTLSQDQAKTKVEDLLQTNGECEFPCWWGITPGENNIFEVKALLMTMAIGFEKLRFQHEGKEGYKFTLPNNNLIDIDESLLVSLVVDKESKIVESIYTGQDFSISPTIEKFGFPDHIFIQATERVGVGPGFYHIYVFYESLGVIAVITGKSEFIHKNGEDYTILCQSVLQSQGKGDGFFLWSPEKPITLKEVLYNPQNDFPPQPIEDVTNMTVENFYNLLIGHNPDECLEIPMGYWGY